MWLVMQVLPANRDKQTTGRALAIYPGAPNRRVVCLHNLDWYRLSVNSFEPQKPVKNVHFKTQPQSYTDTLLHRPDSEHARLVRDESLWCAQCAKAVCCARLPTDGGEKS